MTTKKILPTLLSIALPILLSGCSSENDDAVRTGKGTAVIVPTATINIPQVFSSRANDLSGVVSGKTFPKDTKNVFAVTAYRGNAVPTKDYDKTYFHNQSVDANGMGEMAFSTPQRYPKTDNLYFYTYSPVMPTVTAGVGYKSNGSAAPTVTFNIEDNKLTDILWARNVDGIAWAGSGATNQKHPSFAFEHMLQQLRFKFVKGVGFNTGCKVTKISVTGNPTSPSDEDNMLKSTATLNLIEGTMKYEGSGNVVQTLGNLSCEVKDAADAKEIAECFLTRPIKKVTLTITCDMNPGGSPSIQTFTADAELNGTQTDKGGKLYLVTIELRSGLEVKITVEENNWHVCPLDEQTIGGS